MEPHRTELSDDEVPDAPATPNGEETNSRVNVSPSRAKRVRAVKRSVNSSIAGASESSAETTASEERNSGPRSLTRAQLSSNETLDVPTSPPHHSHVTVRIQRGGSETVVGDDSGQTLNESTVDLDTIYDDVLEDVNRSNQENEIALAASFEEDSEELRARQTQEEQEDEEEEEFDSFVFIASLPPREELPPLPLSPVMPVPARSTAIRKTLILDLDETLVHCSLEAIDDADLTFVVPFQGSEYARRKTGGSFYLYSQVPILFSFLDLGSMFASDRTSKLFSNVLRICLMLPSSQHPSKFTQIDC